MKLRPLQGQVLVELIPYDKLTESGLELPDTVRRKDTIGKMPGQRAKVLRMGVWKTTKSGKTIPYDFREGNIVIVDPTMGTNAELGRSKLKFYDANLILGVES